MISPYIYGDVYYASVMALAAAVGIGAIGTKFRGLPNHALNMVLGHFVVVVLILYMGLRPLHGVFADMTTYARYFEGMKLDTVSLKGKDIGFDYFVLVSAKLLTVPQFFLLCTVIYVVPLYAACRKLFGQNWFYGFLVIISSFGFWAYGVNGMRNGMASSLFIYAIAVKRKGPRLALMGLSVGMHMSMLIPIAAYVSTHFVRNIRPYLFAWVVSIPFAILLGRQWQGLLARSGLADDRLSYLIDAADASKFASVGFRWDFLIYGAIPIAVGMYFIRSTGACSEFYRRLFSTYAATNAFWITVIYANFSNRFAYLSWALFGLVIVYPILCFPGVRNRSVKLFVAVCATASITSLLVFR